MVDEILANGNMDRMGRIERLESILSAATQHALVPTPTPIPPIPASLTFRHLNIPLIHIFCKHCPPETM